VTEEQNSILIELNFAIGSLGDTDRALGRIGVSRASRRCATAAYKTTS